MQKQQTNDQWKVKTIEIFNTEKNVSFENVNQDSQKPFQVTF